MNHRKKYQSIVRKVVLLPLIGMLTVMVIIMISSFLSFRDIQKQMLDNNLNSLQISINQLDNLLRQIDHLFVEYWNQEECFQYMRAFPERTPKEDYFLYSSDTMTWMNKVIASYDEVQGAFVFFDNLELLLFRGTTDQDIHSYIRTLLMNEEEDRWRIIEVQGQKYLMGIKKYDVFRGGVWIPVSIVEKNLGLHSGDLMGTAFLMDYRKENTYGQSELVRDIFENSERSQDTAEEKNGYYHYSVQADSEDLSLGILIPRRSIIENLPFWYRMVIALTILSMFLIPLIILWLQRKIARPIRIIDNAMQIIGEGDTDYRIVLSGKRTENEFDRLMTRLNQMMDELNELEFSLYRTKIREQKTQLKYISQQIRPHFILNALNQIYTYDENEFPLVKKMVLYLTEYFRYIVNLRKDFVELHEEMHHVENYLNIQKERYEGRFDFFVEWEIAAKKQMIPPLLIQTFVENSIKYGMREDGKSFVYVLASKEDNMLKLVIADTGKGFPDEVLDRVRRFAETRQYDDELGVGIQNAVERMDILYDRRIRIEFRNALSGGAVTEIYLPWEEENV